MVTPRTCVINFSLIHGQYPYSADIIWSRILARGFISSLGLKNKFNMSKPCLTCFISTKIRVFVLYRSRFTIWSTECQPRSATTVLFMVFSIWFFADSVKKNKARYTKHTWSVNLPFFLIDTTENRYWARISENILFALEITCSSAILTSCIRHDVNNVKERRNAADLAQKKIKKKKNNDCKIPTSILKFSFKVKIRDSRLRV